MKKITVNVTARDIAKGCKADGKTCAIARALARVLPKSATEYQVGAFWTEYKTRRGTYHAPHSSDVTKFINNFDDGNTVQPSRFTLEFERV